MPKDVTTKLLLVGSLVVLGACKQSSNPAADAEPTGKAAVGSVTGDERPSAAAIAREPAARIMTLNEAAALATGDRRSIRGTPLLVTATVSETQQGPEGFESKAIVRFVSPKRPARAIVDLGAPAFVLPVVGSTVTLLCDEVTWMPALGALQFQDCAQR
ncbi:MAG: hypothetical protein JNM74_14975 [Myxococcales bacterium]|jgi:hypothetical protein|nr:hypothetical protein [Myxococcales bacterium]